MKIFYLGCQDIFGEVNNGGIQGARKNWELIVSNVGSENVFTSIICNKKISTECNIRYFQKVEGNMKAVISNLCLCRYYMPNEERRILDYIDKVSPDIVFVDTSLFGRIIKKIRIRYRTIVFFHNIESSYARHRLITEGIKVLPMFISTVYNEKLSVKYSDKIAGLNNRDAQKLEMIYGRKMDELIPVGFNDIYCAEKIKRRKDKNLIFVGSYFGPNYDGVKWFIENVLKKLPDYKLKIIGRDFEKVKDELEQESVEIIGTVKDISQYYYENSMIVMPIRYGDGMKVKTAEAMMYGMTIFATDEALEGYIVDDIEGIYRCNSEKEFVQSILEYYEKEFQNENRMAREAFKKNNSFESQVDKMKKLIGV